MHALLGDWKKWIRTKPTDLHPNPLSHHHHHTTTTTTPTTPQSTHPTIPRSHLPTDAGGKIILPSHAPGHYRSPTHTWHFETHQKLSKEEVALLVGQWQHRCEAILILLQVHIYISLFHFILLNCEWIMVDYHSLTGLPTAHFSTLCTVPNCSGDLAALLGGLSQGSVRTWCD